jgi:hypothetical protein
MKLLLSKTVYRPAIAHLVIYLTEIMSGVDFSIGAAMVVLIGALAIQLMGLLRVSGHPQ